MGKTALILGSSGLIGSILLQKLLLNDAYSKVIIIVRKPQQINHPKLIEIITDFNTEIDWKTINQIDSIFSCLGTTRKITPDLVAYHKIEIDIPVQFAKIGNEKGLSKFHYVSAIGANKDASNFYLKMKGEAEQELKQCDLQQLFIYQPSLLIGNRNEKRFGENIASKIFPLLNKILIGKLSKYKSIKAEKLAQAILNYDLKESTKKVNILLYDKLIKN